MYVRYIVASSVDHTLLAGESAAAAAPDAGNGHGQDRSSRNLRELIEADADPLVRGALLERQGWPHADGDELLQQPLDARLARLQGVRDAEEFARIVRQAMSSGVVPESELVAMVKEWVNQPGTLGRLTEKLWCPWDPDSNRYMSRDFEALWKLVPDVPEVVASVLVAKLPATTTTLSPHQIPEEVLHRIGPALLAKLFWRADVDLEDYRKKIALTHPLENGGDSLVWAACHRAFDLTYVEFEHLMQSEPKRLAAMSDASHMSPVLLQAAAEFFSGKLKIKPPERGSSIDRAYMFEGTLDRRLRSMEGWGAKCYLRSRQLWALRVYALARNLASDHDEFWRKYGDALLKSDSHRWLRRYVIPGDIWSTYVKLFDAAWREVGEKLFCGRERNKSDAQVQRWEDVLPIPTELENARREARDRATGDVRIQKKLRRLENRLGVIEHLNRRVAIVERVATGARDLFLLACLMQWPLGQPWSTAVSNAVVAYLALIVGGWVLAWVFRAFCLWPTKRRFG